MANEFPPGLEPSHLWQHFDAIRRIPRGSGNEAAAMAHLEQVATDRGWPFERDAIGNLVVRVPATPGMESRSPIVLQGHIDIVCEKNSDVEFDFEKDGINVELVDGFLTAIGTTLGADNGIGVATAFGLADDPDAAHGPLEVLVTVDEETGMTGAFNLQPGFITARRMINLDTEEIGAVYVGCSGGGDVITRFRFDLEARDDDEVMVGLMVDGLRGGHSGLNIDENRANAVKLLARVLFAAQNAGIDAAICRIMGGSKRNAIPREAKSGLAVPSAQVDDLIALVAQVGGRLAAEFAGIDPDINIRAERHHGCECRERLSLADTRKLVAALVANPSGVLSMSRDVPGLVETSNNLGVVTTEDGLVTVVNCSRSSIGSALDGVREGLNCLYTLAGAEVELDAAYPGWQPDMASPLLATARQVHEQVFGQAAEIKAVHAGLECGLIGEAFPGLDMISIGPDILGAHSPDERVNVETVQRYYAHLKAILLALD